LARSRDLPSGFAFLLGFRSGSRPSPPPNSPAAFSPAFAARLAPRVSCLASSQHLAGLRWHPACALRLLPTLWQSPSNWPSTHGLRRVSASSPPGSACANPAATGLPAGLRPSGLRLASGANSPAVNPRLSISGLRLRSTFAPGVNLRCRPVLRLRLLALPRRAFQPSPAVSTGLEELALLARSLAHRPDRPQACALGEPVRLPSP